MIKTKNILGLSVAELLVTLFLLAIFILISTLSFVGYSKDTRDAIRMSNLDLIYNSLIAVKTTSGRYPVPDEGKKIIYSGETIWDHGIIGEEVSDVINSVLFIDPKYKRKREEKALYFSYSLLKDNSTFQIGTILEDSDNDISMLSKTYANSETTYSVGNFNGLYIKVFVGGEIHILSVPSLIISDNSDHELLLDNVNPYFSISGTSSLPGRYFNKFESAKVIDFIPRLLYKGSTCGVQSDKDIVDFISNLRESYNISPFVGDDFYYDVFADYDFLMTNFHNFEELKILGYKINKSLQCDLDSFKTSNLFPVTCGNEDGTFDLIDDDTNVNDTCLYKYEGSGDAVVKPLIGFGGTKGLFISNVGYGMNGTLSYKIFSYNPIKIDFHYKADFGHSDSYFKFFIDGVEYISKDKDSPGISNYTFFESALIPIGFHEFKWKLSKFESTQADLFLDNMRVYCVGSGLGC